MSAAEALVAEIAAGGHDPPDGAQLRALKELCRDDESGAALRATHDALLGALSKRRATAARVAALRTMDELFRRSHQFRVLVLGRLRELFRLAFGAHDTGRVAAECYYAWVERFGAAYQRLVYGFRYLRFIEKVDFRDAARAYRRSDPENVRRRQLSHAENRREYMRRSLVAVRADVATMRRRIEDSLAVLDRCFAILAPDIAGLMDQFSARPETQRRSADRGNEDGDDEDDLDEVLAVMAANRHAINIDIDPDRILEVEETPGNAAVYDAIRDQLRLCVRAYRPRVDIWLAKLQRIDRDIDVDVEQLQALVAGLSERMAVSAAKCADLGVDPSRMHRQPADSHADASEDDFEDVSEPPPRQPQPRAAVAAPPRQHPVFSLLGDSRMAADPTYVDPRRLRSRQARPAQEAEPDPIGDMLRETAPVVSYGPDLMYWGRTEISANTSGLEVRHRFLGSARDEPVLPDAARRRLQMRAVHHAEPERPTIKACRAPLGDGRLCPRRDMVKCPFHGRVVPRDEQGRPQAGFIEAGATEAGPSEPEPTKTGPSEPEPSPPRRKRPRTGGPRRDGKCDASLFKV
ncbi:hypothetical protein H4R18_000657 [Coemansia javaensis]|uniref:UV-stimulated scaffold protein A C-terminal domain-containing protein n=1 Tax=Coemansia javaensis TaxID=2761396 RepID=A0A9W8HNV5_9FUNG|nr:hypothetical protein H4R18_000657 [Coemansia javaensis]